MLVANCQNQIKKYLGEHSSAHPFKYIVLLFIVETLLVAGQWVVRLQLLQNITRQLRTLRDVDFNEALGHFDITHEQDSKSGIIIMLLL